jgi:hypothetical protein
MGLDCQSKVVIEPYPADVRDKPYSHLEPIVKALIDEGNQPSRPECFFVDRDGWRCDLKKPIDFGLVRTRFTIPDSITLWETLDEIFCQNTWTTIKGGVTT